MANLKDTIVLGNLTVTGTITGRTINPNDYYWANMNISTSSNTATTPTFASISLAGASGSGALTYGSVNYGSLAVTGERNGYAGINIGNTNNRMTIMDSGSHAGLYAESGGGWYLCYERASSTLGIGYYGAPASNSQGYKINLHDNTQVVGKIFADQFRGNSTSVAWYQGRDSAVFRNIAVSGYHALWSLKTTNGSWDFGEYSNGSDNNVPVLTYILDDHYNSNSNTVTQQIKFPLASGTVALTSQIKNPTDYYWANVKISSTSNASTSPTFNTMTASAVSIGRILAKSGANTKINIAPSGDPYYDKLYLRYRSVTVGTSWTTIFNAFYSTNYYGACRVFFASSSGQGGYADIFHPDSSIAATITDGYKSADMSLQMSGSSLQAKLNSGSQTLLVWGLGIDG